MTGLERKIIMDFVHDGMQTVAEYIERREFADAVQKIPEITPEIPVRDFGYIGKHEQNVSVYDAMMAEILGEHNAEKARVRNRRKADRKAKRKSGAYVKRNGGDFRKDEHYAGDGRMWHDTYNWDLSKSQTGGKIRERSLRKDFEIEQDNIADAMTEYSDYCIMAEDHAERKEFLKRKLTRIMVDDEWFAVMSEELCREILYEGERVKELLNIAKSIMKGECY